MQNLGTDEKTPGAAVHNTALKQGQQQQPPRNPSTHLAMHPKLQPLPSSLLTALGRSNRQDQLAKALESLDPPVNLRQHRDGRLYPVGVAAYGLDLMVQCTNPEADEAQRLWGLHSITLHTAASDAVNPWRFAWPDGVEADTVNAAGIAKLFGVDGDEAALVSPGMTCFMLPGSEGQTWSMVCMFDPNTQRLQTLSLVRSGEWVSDPQTDDSVKKSA
jgi:hypothetical protein